MSNGNKWMLYTKVCTFRSVYLAVGLRDIPLYEVGPVGSTNSQLRNESHASDISRRTILSLFPKFFEIHLPVVVTSFHPKIYCMR